MSKVTSKLQVTIPKAIADAYGIAPGDEIEFRPAGDSIRVIPPGGRLRDRPGSAERVRLWDAAMRRQRSYEATLELPDEPPAERDWTREDLYRRGEPR